jgi:hypothetical protein
MQTRLFIRLPSLALAILLTVLLGLDQRMDGR